MEIVVAIVSGIIVIALFIIFIRAIELILGLLIIISIILLSIDKIDFSLNYILPLIGLAIGIIIIKLIIKNNILKYKEEKSNRKYKEQERKQEESNREYREKKEREETMNNNKYDPYEILGCSSKTPLDIIKEQHRKLIQMYHPDKATQRGYSKEKADRKTKELNTAWNTIRNERY